MNVIKSFRKISKGRKYCTQNGEEVSNLWGLYGLSIVGCTLGGIGYGFYEGTQTYDPTDNMRDKIMDISINTIGFGVMGVFVGVASPIVFPVVGSAYVYLKLNNE